MARRVRLVAFDMDGVLVPIESSWAYLHRYFGVEEEARKIMKMFEEGKIDYVKWMELDTQLWVSKRSVHITELVEVLRRVPVNPEAEQVSRELHKRGIIIGIISGGIDLLARMVAERMGVDFWLANKLSFDKRGYLRPGGVPLVGVDKRAAMRRVLGEYGVSPGEAMFVGDSRWDASVMRMVAYPVAYGDSCRFLDGVAKCRVRRLLEVVDLVDEVERLGDCPSYRIEGV